MAYSCSVDKDRALGIIELSRSVDDDQVVKAIRALYESDSWDPRFNTLWDGTGITHLVISRKGLQEIVAATERLQPRMGPGKAAFVVRRQLDETMTKIILHMTRTTERERRLFRSRQDALEWLFE